ncbi:MAG TPA: TetR/AcrR family transcriptional regulator [Acidobacteriota bacterium]|nr:TetR/AcrR family transcriptional regulator [Acidobacteriota bacterium]
MNQNGTPEKIIRAAGEAFFRDGIRAVTMDDVARRLGMSKRTLYQHFDSKRSLLREVMLSQTRHIDAVLEKASREDYNDFPTKLRTVLTRLAAALPQPSRRFFQDLRGLAPEVWEELSRERQRILTHHFSRLFHEGRRRGLLHEGFSPELVLQLFLSMIQGLINPNTLAEMPLSAPQILDRIVTVLLTGILRPEAANDGSQGTEKAGGAG